MKILVVTKAKHPLPPEAAPGLIDALSGWARRHTENGKMEAAWSFAGMPGGGGVLNVESLEELDAIMTEFPLAAFSEIELYPLVELHESLQRTKQAFQLMMAG